MWQEVGGEEIDSVSQEVPQQSEPTAAPDPDPTIRFITKQILSFHLKVHLGEKRSECKEEEAAAKIKEENFDRLYKKNLETNVFLLNFH